MRLYSGRLAEAEEDLRQTLRQDPSSAKAHWALSKLGKTAVSDDELLAMQRLATKLPPGSQDEVYLRFAQFNRLDRAGRFADAWQALARGCEAKRKLVAYDESKTRAFFDALKLAFPPGVAVWVERCVTAQSGSDWCLVDRNNTVGWVNARFLTLLEDWDI